MRAITKKVTAQFSMRSILLTALGSNWHAIAHLLSRRGFGDLGKADWRTFRAPL
jgi:hypothetical protein